MVLLLLLLFLCPKQPRTSFPFYKFIYPTISGRISECNTERGFLASLIQQWEMSRFTISASRVKKSPKQLSEYLYSLIRYFRVSLVEFLSPLDLLTLHIHCNNIMQLGVHCKCLRMTNDDALLVQWFIWMLEKLRCWNVGNN